jgi:thiol-disulfide isomerase/thioredoxin
MIVDLSEIRDKTVTIDEYISTLDQIFIERFLIRKQTYQLKVCAVEELRKSADSYVLVVFSASWCKDCAEQIPVLDLVADSTGLEVRVFGGIKKDPLSHFSKWRVPPSPPEVNTLCVEKLPTIIVFDSKGVEAGRIEERPKMTLTLEEELCEIVKSSRR